MEQTARFAIPQLVAGQMQKELVHNEAMQRIDMLLCPVVEGPALGTPPASPAVGACYLVAESASGAWSGQDGALACFTQAGWKFAGPVEGMTVLDRSSGLTVMRRSGAWESGIARLAEVRVNGDAVLKQRQAAVPNPGGGSTVDAECRAAVIGMLDRMRAHGLIA